MDRFSAFILQKSKQVSTTWILQSSAPHSQSIAIRHLAFELQPPISARRAPKNPKVNCIIKGFHQILISSPWDHWSIVQIIRLCYTAAIPLLKSTFIFLSSTLAQSLLWHPYIKSRIKQRHHIYEVRRTACMVACFVLVISVQLHDSLKTLHRWGQNCISDKNSHLVDIKMELAVGWVSS